MLQVTRSYQPTMKMRSSQKPNFITRNKQSVHAKSKLEGEKRQENVPRASRAPPRRAEPAKEKPDKNTVVISKDYLDQLLRMSMTTGREPQPHPRPPVEAQPPHVTLDHCQVPGLSAKVEDHTPYKIPVAVAPITAEPSNATLYQPPPCGGVATAHPPHTSSISPRGRGVSHEQWLVDLASQAEEQRKKKLAEKQRRQYEVPEEYYPWGRPGGGAPVRPPPTQPLADYVSPTTERQQRQYEVSEEYYPWGRPGGGAPARPPPTQPLTDYITPTTEKQRRQYEVPEEYSPWGRPGGGAPVRPPPTQPLADYGTPTKGKGIETYRTPVNPSHYLSPPPPPTTTHMDHTPQFARGAGPHVDQYVLQQREQQRRKDQEHMEFIRLQIAEKERRQAEQRMKKEQEEREEEARLAAERTRLQREHQWEAERQQRKEEEAATRRTLLQQRIAEAENDARRMREEARRGRGQQPWLGAVGEGESATSPKHAMSTVHFREPLELSLAVPQRSSQLLLPDNLRSPSMQVLAEPASPRNAGGQKDRHEGQKDTARTGSRHSLLSKKQQKSGENEVGKGRSERRNPLASQSQTALKDDRYQRRAPTGKGPQNGARNSQKTTTTQEPPRRSSKIPVRRAGNSGRISHGANSGRNTCTARIAKEPATTQHRARARSPPVAALAHKVKITDSTSSSQPLLQPSANTLRSASPPVPALAQRLAQNESQTHKSVSFSSSAGRVPAQPCHRDSPPVPALANRLQAQRPHSPPVPALASRLRSDSPPVPALANRLHTDSPPVPALANRLRSDSPPVPAVANRKYTDTHPHRTSAERVITQFSVPSDTISSESHSGELHSNPPPDDGICFSIYRPPSCAPITSPLETSHLATQPALPTGGTPHLPSLPPACHTPQLNTLGMFTPTATGQNRQDKLLQELAALRKGLISQKSDLDERVKQILSRNACVL